LGLNVGVLGLVLWGVFLLLLARFGWRAWQRHKEPLGLALAIMVVMFVLRGLLDSTFRNHVIEQFVLVAALLFTALLLEYPDEPKNV
jgi:O-antigen ligase